MDHLSIQMLTGNGQNRWADKPLNFIVSKNGRIGGTGEHSVADGAEFGHILENMLYADYHFIKYSNTNKDFNEKQNINGPIVQKLDFEINDEVKDYFFKTF